jgi:hypothetical protein
MSSTLARSAPAPRAGAILLFVLAAFATVCWLGVNLTFPALQATGVLPTATRLLSDAAILAGLWLGLARTKLEHRARLVTLIGTYPTVMIPAFAVPTSLMLHALSLRQLARLRRNHTLSRQA